MYFFRKIGLVSILVTGLMSSHFAFADDAVFPSKDYVDDMFELKANKLNGTATSGQKIGDLAAGSGAGQDQVMYPSAAAVKQYSQKKPTSGVANGKVLTYTGTDANASVSAAYVKLPVAAGAPSSNTPTSFVEVWVQ